MPIHRILKVALGLLTMIPAVYVVLFIALIARMVLWRVSGDPRAGTMPIPIADLMWAHLAVMVLIAALATFYLLYLFRTDRVHLAQRTTWAGATLPLPA